MADIKDILIENYIPYAKGTIISRAIPGIDGLKPVNRRVLFTMHKMGLTNKMTKSANVVGNTMELHPHGEDSIYDALVRMTTGNESLNLPYIKSKGNFGKVYYSELQWAAKRYTEVKLDEITKEMFEGINENAVDFVPNYDGTTTEPVLLPVKFPSILVNTSSGIAVGMSSSIPSFGLRPVCEATIGILEERVNDVSSLMKILEAPDFTTYGFIHGEEGAYNELCRTGRGTVTITGGVELHKDRIIVREVPFKSSVEAIESDVIDGIKSGDFKEISDIKNESDLDGVKIVIYLKRGQDPKKVLRKLMRRTRLKNRVSFITRVIIDGKPRQLGLLELLQEWIKFRINTIDRIYRFRADKKREQEHLLKTWERIGEDIESLAVLIASKTEEESIRELKKEKYGLDDIQIKYILDMRVRDLTKNRVTKKKDELYAIRKDLEILDKVINSEEEKKKVIISELKYISNKYGKDRMTRITGEYIEEKELTPKEIIEDVSVVVAVTSEGYIKRLISLEDISNFETHEGDSLKYYIKCNNQDDIIVLTYDGTGYKIPVHSIDMSRGLPKDKITNMLNEVNNEDIMYITNAGDYSETLNLVFSNGRGMKLRLSKMSGPRSKYINLFPAGNDRKIFFTTEDQFFVITRKRRAVYVDVTYVNYTNRVAFKAGRIPNDDYIYGIQPLSKVPDVKKIDFERYSKGYCVKIRENLW